MQILKRVLLALILVMAGFSFSSAMDDDEEFFQTVSRAPAEYSLRRAYAGARDEQPLEVQAVLPQPLRSPDGSSISFNDASEVQGGD